jgi:hypothetical protein
MKPVLQAVMGEGDRPQFEPLTHPCTLKLRAALSRKGRGHNNKRRVFLTQQT